MERGPGMSQPACDTTVVTASVAGQAQEGHCSSNDARQCDGIVLGRFWIRSMGISIEGAD